MCKQPIVKGARGKGHGASDEGAGSKGQKVRRKEQGVGDEGVLNDLFGLKHKHPDKASKALLHTSIQQGKHLFLHTIKKKTYARICRKRKKLYLCTPIIIKGSLKGPLEACE